jgi:hypothetical protein
VVYCDENHSQSLEFAFIESSRAKLRGFQEVAGRSLTMRTAIGDRAEVKASEISSVCCRGERGTEHGDPASQLHPWIRVWPPVASDSQPLLVASSSAGNSVPRALLTH